jgi:hypothetical protein
MPLLSALREQSGLVPYSEWEGARVRPEHPENEPEAELTPDEERRYKIIRYCLDLFDDAQKAREPFNTFDQCWDLFIGNFWGRNWPQWRARITIQKIWSFITFMQAIMTDNKPRLHVEPRLSGSEDAADLLTKLVDRDWDENNMQQKISQFVKYGLIWGTGFMKITYDPYANGGRGKHLASAVVPYKIWTNRTSTCIEDAENLFHVDDVTMGWIHRNFPDKANVLYGLRGVSGVTGTRDRTRDYILEGTTNETARIISAQKIDGNIVAPQISSLGPDSASVDRDTVEVMECWLQDPSWEPYERQKVENGKALTEPVIGPDGEYVYEVTGRRMAISEIDGAPFMAPVRTPKQKPVMERVRRQKYPNGRLVMIAAGRVLLRDIPNPYQTDGFPFAMWKDHDMGTFWGQGEPLALKDLAIASNRIVSEVYNILDKVGNPSYKLDKGSGLNPNMIKNKPGTVLTMEGIEKLQPLEKPPIPHEFFELFDIIQKAMGQVSGINDSIQGNMPASNTAFATIDQLTEAGSAPIRLKVRNSEVGYTRIGRLRVQLIQQFDARHEPGVIRIPEHELASIDPEPDGEGEVVQPAANVAVQFKEFKNADLQGQVEFNVVPISSLSTSPASTWNKFMQLHKDHLIDRRWFHDKMRIEGWRTELPRMERQEQQDAAMQAAARDKSRPGPTPKTTPSRGHRPKNTAPPSHIPSAHQRAAVR